MNAGSCDLGSRRQNGSWRRSSHMRSSSSKASRERRLGPRDIVVGCLQSADRWRVASLSESYPKYTPYTETSDRSFETRLTVLRLTLSRTVTRLRSYGKAKDLRRHNPQILDICPSSIFSGGLSICSAFIWVVLTILVAIPN